MNKSIRVSKMLRGKRLELGISQEDLAKKIGMKQGQFISNIERDLCALPVKYIREISKILDIDPRDITVLMKEDFNEYLDEQLTEQIKAYWTSKEAAPVLVEAPIVAPVEVKAPEIDNNTFVRDLRTKMDKESLYR